MTDHIKSIADTLEDRYVEIDDGEETGLVADFLEKKGLEMKKATDAIVRIRSEQDESFEAELMNLAEEGKL